MKKNLGFTLIEAILVIGLVTAMGAMAAPAVQSVFGDSKKDLEQLQMTQVMVAYQQALEYGFETEAGLTEEEKVHAFLEEQKSNPTWLPVAESACCVTGDGTLAEIYMGKVIDDRLYLECTACGLRSEDSILLREPPDPIAYPYGSEMNAANGTWMVIGDDDRLRADYIRDLMYHVQDEETEKGKESQNYQGYRDFVKKAKQEKEYRYRTTFLIRHTGEAEAEVNPADGFWRLFTHTNVEGTQKIGLDLNALPVEADVLYRYRYVQGNHWTGDPWEYQRLQDAVERKNVAAGHTKEEAHIEFKINHGGEDSYRKYGVQVIQKPYPEPSESNNNDVCGWIQTGENHWFYYELLDSGASQTGGGSWGTVPSNGAQFDFHTGFVFNINNDNNDKYNNYDFLSFEPNDKGNMVLRSYTVRGGRANLKSEAELNGFEFNTPYTMELIVKKGETNVDVSDDLLNEWDQTFTTSSDLHPAIGYYMNNESVLDGEVAVTEDPDQIPLVTYEAGADDGPRFVLMGMPEIYPYQSKSEPENGEDSSESDEEFEKPDEPVKLEAPEIERLGVSTLTINPVEFRVSTETEGDFKMVLKLPDGSLKEIASSSQIVSIEQSGVMEAYVEANGKRSKTVKVNVENIIPPLAEIEMTYEQDRWFTDFELSNYKAVIAEMEPYQKRETLRLVLETKGSKSEVTRSDPWMFNSDVDLDDLAIYVESEFGEVLSPKAEIQEDSSEEVNVLPPVITPAENGRVEVESQPGTTIFYQSGWSWYDAYGNQVAFDLEEGETLEVYAKSLYGEQKSETISYTRESAPEEPPVELPAPPSIDKPSFNRSTIVISATDYDTIWYRCEYQQNWKDTKWTSWESSNDEIRINGINGKEIIRVEACTEKDGLESETVFWSKPGY